MNFFKTKYRVISIGLYNFRAQYRPWYSPIWFKCRYYDELTLEDAKLVCEMHRQRLTITTHYFD